MTFSQFYFSPQELVKDCQKMRIRLGSYIHELSFRPEVGNCSLAEKIKQKVGIVIPCHYNPSTKVCEFEKFFTEHSEVKDLLDVISVVYMELNNQRGREALIKFVNDCFVEEGLAYIMNAQGEVRFRPDQEFERNRILTLKLLAGSDLDSVITAFNNAFYEFQTDIKNSKSALRHMFEANESLFKMLVKPEHDCTRLSAHNIEVVKNHILNDLLGQLDETAKNASAKQLESYKEWIDSIHLYRHGQDSEFYDNPPVDFTILALSNGASFLRWLASMMQIKKEKNKQVET